MRAVLMVVGLAMCLVLSGCGDSRVKPGYTPIPDKQLYAQIAAVPGVTKVQIKYLKSFDSGDGYVGDVTVRPGIDALAVLDRAIAILRQGRFDIGIEINAIQNRHEISTDGLGLKSPGEPYLTERYGPQPGNGKPPARDK